MNSEIIPLTIRPYIKEIADKLLDGRAAVMVGAGFSRNATKSHATQKSLPTWSELGDIFFEKIYGRMPDADARYMNILKLAEEVDATFGRAVLNQILISNIPDKEYLPSDLHVKLLKLNWTDVFTTNYDTLLERACENVFSKRYDVIVNQEDLVYSRQPRIIKLHGTFPSDRPLIISESDYRKYPRQFAPFINTVQQSLLENTFCLIGFSADDPNFLQWIGWIHDNLGKENSPRIYLIGLFKFSDVQIRHLESKNIIVVNLDCYGNTDHSVAINLFINQLSDFHGYDNITWPAGHGVSTINLKRNFKDVADSWQEIRLSYPNWVVLPQENREILWKSTSNQVNSIEDILESDTIVDIEYCFELNWRLEKCLCPLIDNTHSIFYKVFRKYRFLGISHEEGVEENQLAVSASHIYILQEKWVDLGIALLRSFRERGELDLWKNLFDQLVRIKDKFNAESIAKFLYEKSLYSLAINDYLTLLDDIESWPSEENLPFWEVKRAGLLVEIGQYKESLRILERTLSYVRRHLNLNVQNDDYLWQSHEGYIMYLHYCVSKNINYQFNSHADVEYWKRWSELSTSRCNPTSEIRHFELILKREFVPWSNISEKEGFDIGFKYRRYSSKENSEVLKGYSYIRFWEEIGFPLGMRHFSANSEAMVGALSRIMNYSPNLVVTLLYRCNDNTVVNEVLDRNLIATIEIGNIDFFIENYLKSFFSISSRIELRNVLDRMVTRMPEVLSRLCVKCSHNSRYQLIDFIFEVYKGKYKVTGLYKLLKRLADCGPELFTYENVLRFLEVPLDILDDDYFPEPLFFFDANKMDSGIQISVPEWQIIKLLEQSKGENVNRSRATYRLFILQELGLLNEYDIIKFNKVVWESIDKNGYPLNINFDLRVLLKNSGVKRDEVIEVFKKYLFNRDFVNDEPGSLSIYSGRIRLANDIIWISQTLHNPNGIAWTTEEQSIIIKKLMEWWSKDRLLVGKFKNSSDVNEWMSPVEELNRRFKIIIDVAVKIISENQGILRDDEILVDLIYLITEMEQDGVPVLRAKARFFHDFYDDFEDFINDIERSIKHKDQYELVDAYDAILYFTTYHRKDEKLQFNIKRVLQLAEIPLRWNIVPQKRHSSSIFVEIMNYIPEIEIDFALPSILEHLYRELKTQNESEVENNLIYARNNVKLALASYNWYHRREHRVPLLLEEWREFVQDKQQFSDISNLWCQSSPSTILSLIPGKHETKE